MPRFSGKEFDNVTFIKEGDRKSRRLKSQQQLQNPTFVGLKKQAGSVFQSAQADLVYATLSRVDAVYEP
jgi:hypothetical protein